jgi:FkbM family methyltransferase
MVEVLGNGLNHAIDFSRLNEKSIIIDAGAAVGGFVSEIRRRPQTKKSKVVCIECSKPNIEKFKNNSFKNVVLMENALSDIDGKTLEFTEFKGGLKADGHHRYYQWGNTKDLYADQLKNQSIKIEKYKVETVSLNSLLAAHNITNIDYLKLDIEGSEYEVIGSLTPACPAHPLQISIELHIPDKNNHLMSHLNRLGYTLERYGNNELYASK